MASPTANLGIVLGRLLHSLQQSIRYNFWVGKKRLMPTFNHNEFILPGSFSHPKIGTRWKGYVPLAQHDGLRNLQFVEFLSVHWCCE
jgi:hypothetical protein